MRDKQLTVEIIDGVLTISVGVETLAKCVKIDGDFIDGSDEFAQITDVDLFASEIAKEIEQEDAYDNVLLHVMFDKAAENITENGTESIIFPEEKTE